MDALFAPIALEYVPAPHKVHEDALVPPVPLLYVPAPHCVHTAAPASDHVPCPQVTQEAADLAPSVFEAVPALQAWQVELLGAEIAAEKVPFPQGVHEGAPAPENVPAPHDWQVLADVAASTMEKDPAAQGVQVLMEVALEAEL